MASNGGRTPRQSVEAECRRIGLDEVVATCSAILGGHDADDAFLLVIGGPGARAVIGGRAGVPAGYWPRTWAARALLYAWGDRATSSILAAAADPSWRVREMAAKVIARHRLDNGYDVVEALLADPVPRVRAAATRARQRLTA